ncbi:hypothetical protein [Thermocatellispora tengchongensis]|uniref:hypothetical protein n=1 Tax=Thermocatellispora tengchongensis TaxID=1073253 RepID=UPI00363E5654
MELWEEYRRQGPPYSEAEHGGRFSAFIELAARHGRPDLGVDMAVNGTGLFGPAPVAGWHEIQPWVRHVHGKFFGIDGTGEEPSVPVRELIALLVGAGYSGAVSSEYEGWHWNSWDDAFDMVAGEQAVQRSAAERAGSRMITDPRQARDLLPAHLARTPA